MSNIVPVLKDKEVRLGREKLRRVRHLKAADRGEAPVQSSRESDGVVMRKGSHLVDRKPLDNCAVMLIYSNAKSKLRPTPFDFEIVHRPCVSNMAD